MQPEEWNERERIERDANLLWAKMVEVETGISDFENIEIISGLEDDVDVIKGPYIAISQKLKDGTIIKIKKDEKRGGKSNSREASISVEVGS